MVSVGAVFSCPFKVNLTRLISIRWVFMVLCAKPYAFFSSFFSFLFDKVEFFMVCVGVLLCVEVFFSHLARLVSVW